MSVDPLSGSSADGAAVTRLHGRDKALQVLFEAVERVRAEGGCELVLISGAAGVGKSSLFGELKRQLRSSSLIFGAGKFDQYQHQIPYATLVQALRGIVQEHLARPELELRDWRGRLSEALGQNAQLMIDLIPELEFVIGAQPRAPQTDLTSAQGRFHAVFQALIGALASADHPLVLFIDDLQWLDHATLELLRRLGNQDGPRHVLFVGAYRDGELEEEKPLANALESLRASKATLSEIRLKPLSEAETGLLLADVFGGDQPGMAPLARTVHRKTAGNPYFAIQFARELAADGTLQFEPQSAGWKWAADPTGIDVDIPAEPVSELVSRRLRRLPRASRELLTRMAILGHSTEIACISFLEGKDAVTVRKAMEPAVDAELIRADGETLAFAHDHIQSAAYALIPAGERSMAHLAAAEALVSYRGKAGLAEYAYEIAGQYDKAQANIISFADRIRAAEIFFLAGMRAKASSAYAIAQSYFEKAEAISPPNPTADSYRLAFDIGVNIAECEIVGGHFTEAENRLSALASLAENQEDLSKATCLVILLLFSTGQSERAVQAGIGFLTTAGIGWPAIIDEKAVLGEFRLFLDRLDSIPLEALADHPEMHDPAMLATMSVMTELFPAAYATDRRMMEYVLLKMTNISLEHGHCESSAVAYSALNMAIGVQFGEHRIACAFGELARGLIDRYTASRHRARVCALSAAFAMPWVKPLSAITPLMIEAFRLAQSTGDIAYAAYSARNQMTHSLMLGKPLNEIQYEVEEAIAFASGIELGMPAERFFSQYDFIRSLRGDSQPVDVLQLGSGEAAELSPGVAMMTCYRWVFQLAERYLSADFSAALKSIDRVEPLRWAMRSSIEEAEFDFYAALAIAASGLEHTEDTAGRAELIGRISRHSQRLEDWAASCPENFECRSTLVRAELARVSGDGTEAQKLYEQAARQARALGYVQVEALACELAGRYYARQGLETASDAYIGKARSCYERWGCIIKVGQIDREHPHLAWTQADPAEMSVTPTIPLDGGIVGTAMQALSTELAPNRLLDKLMRTLVQNVGVDRAILVLLDEEDKMYVGALASEKEELVEVSTEHQEIDETILPMSLIRFVVRTGAPFRFSDSGNFPGGLQHATGLRDCACFPVFYQTRLIGLLYVDHSRIEFSESDAALVEFLASQAGTWIENARLYSELRRNETWLREAQRLSGTGSFTWSSETDALVCSPEMYRLYQLPADGSLTLSNLTARIHPNDSVDIGDHVRALSTFGKSIDAQFRLRMNDDTFKHVKLVARKWQTNNGELSYVGTLQDVTESQRAQEALAIAQSELTRVSRSVTLGVLTASIAHEVNQPLTGIVTNATTCEMMLSSDPPNLTGALLTVRRCVRDGHRAAEVIKRLRALFTNRTSAPEPVDLNEVIEEVIGITRNELQRYGIIVRTNLYRPLPPVEADRIQIQQVILNLLINASDAVKETNSQLQGRVVRISTEIEDGKVRFNISDSGPGLGPEKAKRVFEPFYTTKANGMGVGLAVSRSIIESLDGRLWVEQKDDPGASFSFTIPRARLHGMASPAGPASVFRSDTVQ